MDWRSRHYAGADGNQPLPSEVSPNRRQLPVHSALFVPARGARV